MKITQTLNNFSRGQLDHRLQGRFDLPIYLNSFERSENMLTNFVGNMMRRPGTIYDDTVFDCRLERFRFNDEQSYILLFYNTKVRFMSYDTDDVFGYVLSGASPLEVTTPYSLAESKELQFAQDKDVIYIVHPDYAPRKLTRTGAAAFSLSTVTFEDGPYLDINSTSTTVNVAAGGTPGLGELTATSSSAIWTSADVGRQFRFKANSSSEWAWGTITAFTSTTEVTIDFQTVVSAVANSTDWRFGAFYTGNYPSSVTFHKKRLAYASTENEIKTVWLSVAGEYDRFSPDEDADDAVTVELGEVSEGIDWLFSGGASLIAGTPEAPVAINGGSPSEPITATDIQATKASVDGASSDIPVFKDGLVFYVSLDGRNVFAFQYDILSEKFATEDMNLLSRDITKTGLGRSAYVKNENDIIYFIRGDGALVAFNFKQKENINGWTVLSFKNGDRYAEVQDIVTITDNYGVSQLFLLMKTGSTYTIEHLSNLVEFPVRDDFYTGDKDEDDARHFFCTVEALRDCIYVDSAVKYNRYQEDNTITYNSAAGTVTATNAVFSSGDVGNYIYYSTTTGEERGVLEITAYTSTTVVEVSEIFEPSTTTCDDWYISFSTVTGLTDFDGETVSVIADGAYIGEFTISSNTLTLDNEYASIVFGYNYSAWCKLFNFGFMMQAKNLQVEVKSLSQIAVRLSHSAAGKVGTDRYNLSDIQDYEPVGAFYGFPAPLIDGDKFVDYSDETDRRKNLFIVQDVPLPFEVACLFAEVDYETS